jgi:glycine/D-amino acid oxidase-like deaminating enzyme/nitrite reductase/ring-hydroxylating ferredoxin subunit
MPPSSGKADSFWVATIADSRSEQPPLQGDLKVDVAIVGAGIVGLSAALLLLRGGHRVAVLEALQVGRQVTGRSTAKITSQHGLIYRALEKSFGEEGAHAYGAANEAGLAQIVRFAEELGIKCDLERKPAYVYGRSGEYLAKIEHEAEVARRLGLPASFVRECPLPFEVAGGIRFEGQAQFSPCKYLLGLARAVCHGGGRLFEGTRARSIEHGDPCRVVTDQGVITARDVIDATHMPLVSEGKFFAKAYPYAHALVAARIDPARAPDGMFISAEQPTRSVRTARWGEETWLVAAGGSFKPGESEEGEATLQELVDFVRTEFEVDSIDYQWTNEDYESMDGMPFVGRASSSADHLYVATGFNAWGITNGTAAGMILSDLISGRDNSWAQVFDATRMKPLAGAQSFISENIGTGAELVGGYLKSERRSLDELPSGEATIVKLNGERTAVFRDERGHFHAVSAVCTHMGCVLGWNSVDRTWDCSCHGSRFALDGAVLHGPATTGLKRLPTVSKRGSATSVEAARIPGGN